jgi:hypothetical protein
MLSVVLPSGIMLNVIMLIVVIPSVVAPAQINLNVFEPTRQFI